jgi:hypothetical protein
VIAAAVIVSAVIAAAVIVSAVIVAVRVAAAVIAAVVVVSAVIAAAVIVSAVIVSAGVVATAYSDLKCTCTLPEVLVHMVATFTLSNTFRSGIVPTWFPTGPPHWLPVFFLFFVFKN